MPPVVSNPGNPDEPDVEEAKANTGSNDPGVEGATQTKAPSEDPNGKEVHKTAARHRIKKPPISGVMSEERMLRLRSAMMAKMAQIDHLTGMAHLHAFAELLEADAVRIGCITDQDMRVLESLEPHQFPRAVMTRIAEVSPTQAMRVHAATQRPENRIAEVQGSLFDAPSRAVLIHACNTRGSWGMGIANDFKTRYPQAHEVYREYCKSFNDNPKFVTAAPTALETEIGMGGRLLRCPEGDCLLIPPQPLDKNRNLAGAEHWIACLFTKEKPGREKNERDLVLQNTRLALEDLKRQIHKVMSRETVFPEYQGLPCEFWSCRFNSGLFGIHWKFTKAILEEMDMDVTVVRPWDYPS